LIKQGGVKINQEKVISPEIEISGGQTYLIQLGKRKFKKVKIFSKNKA